MLYSMSVGITTKSNSGYGPESLLLNCGKYQNVFVVAFIKPA